MLTLALGDFSVVLRQLVTMHLVLKVAYRWVTISSRIFLDAYKMFFFFLEHI
jgi:hypothetical protein